MKFKKCQETIETKTGKKLWTNEHKRPKPMEMAKTPLKKLKAQS